MRTLKDYYRVFSIKRNIEHRLVEDLVPNIKINSHKKIDVQTEALEFYLLNHLIADLKLVRKLNEPSEPFEWLLDRYTCKIYGLGDEMFTYLTLICVGESRHASDKSSWIKFISDKYGIELKTMFESISPKNRHTAFSKFIENPPKVSLGLLAVFLENNFIEGDYSNSFGGLKWRDIGHHLRSYIKGEISLEILIDVAFNLAHNTGPIFNKGVVFDTHFNKLIHILDIQRAGQLPGWIKEMGEVLFPVIPEMHRLIDRYREEINPNIVYLDILKISQGAVKHKDFMNIISKYDNKKYYEMSPMHKFNLVNREGEELKVA